MAAYIVNVWQVAWGCHIARSVTPNEYSTFQLPDLKTIANFPYLLAIRYDVTNILL